MNPFGGWSFGIPSGAASFNFHLGNRQLPPARVTDFGNRQLPTAVVAPMAWQDFVRNYNNPTSHQNPESSVNGSSQHTQNFANDFGAFLLANRRGMPLMEFPSNVASSVSTRWQPECKTRPKARVIKWKSLSFYNEVKRILIDEYYAPFLYVSKYYKFSVDPCFAVFNREDYEILLRMCYLDNTSEQADQIPVGVEIKVNGNICTLVDRKSPIIITKFCKKDGASNELKLTCQVSDIEYYAVSIYIMKKRTVTDLCSKIKLKNLQNAVSFIKSKLFQEASDEISTTSYKYSLDCPLGMKRMEMPCRTDTCTHIQCFDAAVFLQMNERKGNWLCPVCYGPAPLKSLEIDRFIKLILDQSESSVRKINVHKDGSWTPVTENECEINVQDMTQFEIPNKPSKRILVIDLVDDLDESKIDENHDAMSEKNALHEMPLAKRTRLNSDRTSCTMHGSWSLDPTGEFMPEQPDGVQPNINDVNRKEDETVVRRREDINGDNRSENQNGVKKCEGESVINKREDMNGDNINRRESENGVCRKENDKGVSRRVDTSGESRSEEQNGVSGSIDQNGVNGSEDQYGVHISENEYSVNRNNDESGVARREDVSGVSGSIDQNGVTRIEDINSVSRRVVKNVVSRNEEGNGVSVSKNENGIHRKDEVVVHIEELKRHEVDVLLKENLRRKRIKRANKKKQYRQRRRIEKEKKQEMEKKKEIEKKREIEEKIGGQINKLIYRKAIMNIEKEKKREIEKKKEIEKKREKERNKLKEEMERKREIEKKKQREWNKQIYRPPVMNIEKEKKKEIEKKKELEKKKEIVKKRERERNKLKEEMERKREIEKKKQRDWNKQIYRKPIMNIEKDKKKEIEKKEETEEKKEIEKTRENGGKIERESIRLIKSIKRLISCMKRKEGKEEREKREMTRKEENGPF